MSTMFRGLFEGYAIMSVFDDRLQTLSVDVFRLVIFESYLGNRLSRGYISLSDTFHFHMESF